MYRQADWKCGILHASIDDREKRGFAGKQWLSEREFRDRPVVAAVRGAPRCLES